MSLSRIGLPVLLLILIASVWLVAGPRATFAQSPFYTGYPAYPYASSYSYPYSYLSGAFSGNPVSTTPITTSNPLGSTTLIPAPIRPPALVQTASSTGGSYCNVGDEQIYVPAGASPSDYGCSTTPPASSSPPSS